MTKIKFFSSYITLVTLASLQMSAHSVELVLDTNSAFARTVATEAGDFANTQTFLAESLIPNRARAVADLTSGTIDVAVQGGAIVQSQGQLDFSLFNRGTTAVVIPRGSFFIDYALSIMTLTGPQGLARSISSVTFQVSGGQGATAGYQHSFNDSFLDALDLFSDNKSESGGGSVTILQAGPSGFHVKLEMPEITILPSNSVIVYYNATAGGVSLGTGTGVQIGGGGHSNIYLTLPPGSNVSSDSPLNWISAVPEAPTAAMMLVGLLGCVGTARFARQRGSVT